MGNAAQIWMPYFASTMAIVIAIFVAAWLHNKHIDSLISQFNARFAEVHARIDDIRSELAEIKAILRELQKSYQDLDRRVTRLEERWAPITRS